MRRTPNYWHENWGCLPTSSVQLNLVKVVTKLLMLQSLQLRKLLQRTKRRQRVVLYSETVLDSPDQLHALIFFCLFCIYEVFIDETNKISYVHYLSVDLNL